MKNRAAILMTIIFISSIIMGCAAPTAAKTPGAVPAVSAAAPPAPAVQPVKPGHADYLVVISVDACRPDYFSFADIPNIRNLMKEGASYDRAWVGQLRNNTPPGQTSIATGTFPKNNGILCFGWKDPVNNNGSLPTSWGNVTSGFMTSLIKKSGTTSIGTLFKKAHPGAKVAAISSDKFYAAAGFGAESADFILFSKSGDVSDYQHAADNALAPAGVKGHLASPDVMDAPSLHRKKASQWDSDSWAMDLALKLFEKEKPQIMMINLPDTDEAGHFTGGITDPKVMGKIVSSADKQIGRLMQAYKDAGLYDRTIFVITSDHGMTPTEHDISQRKINAILRESGTWGNPQPEFYLGDPGKAPEAAENIAKAKIPGIHGVYYKTKTGEGQYAYLPTPATAPVITGDLDGCYRYLTSTYASAKSPDVLMVIAENWRQDYKLHGLFKMPGSHDTVTWLSQHVPLVISGPGVKHSARMQSPARLVDIAPTVLTLMGIEPERMDGIVLADALEAPTPAQAARQADVTARLAPLIAALKALSDADLKQGREK